MGIWIRRYADGKVATVQGRVVRYGAGGQAALVGAQAIRYDAAGRPRPYTVQVGPWAIRIQDGHVLSRRRVSR